MKNLPLILFLFLAGCVKQGEGPNYEVTQRKDGSVEKISVHNPDKTFNYLFTFREKGGLQSLDGELKDGKKVHAAFHLNGKLKEYWISENKKLQDFSVFMQDDGKGDYIRQTVNASGESYLNQKIYFDKDGLVDLNRSRFLIVKANRDNAENVKLNIEIVGMKGDFCELGIGDFDENYKLKDSATLVKTGGIGTRVEARCKVKPGQKFIRGYVLDFDQEKNVIKGERIYFTKSLAE